MSFASYPFAQAAFAGVAQSGVPAEPTVTIQCSSVLAFAALGLADATFLIDSISAVAAQHPIRDAAIQSATQTVFRHGSRFALSGGGDFALSAFGGIDTSFGIESGSTVSGVDFWTQAVRFNTQNSGTVPAFSGAFNADMAMRGIGKSVFTPRHVAIKNSAFAFASESSPVFDGDDWVTSPLGKTRSDFSIAGNSQFNGACFWTHGVHFTVGNSRSVPGMVASYNKNMAMRVFGRTEINLETRPIKNAVAVFGGSSDLSVRANNAIASVFIMPSHSASGFASRSTSRSSFSVSGSTQAAGAMLRAIGGSTAISCGSSAAFASAMEAIDVNPVMVADYSAACLTRRNAVFVRTL